MAEKPSKSVEEAMKELGLDKTPEQLRRATMDREIVKETPAIIPLKKTDSGLEFTDSEFTKAIKSGLTLPGDVVSGKQKVTDIEGNLDPTMVSRAFDTAGSAALGSAAFPVDEGALRIFGGMMAKDPDNKLVPNRVKARLFKDRGMSDQEIWEKTGWQQVDGDWKFEINDKASDILLGDTQLKQIASANRGGQEVEGSLPQVFEHDELFKHYPSFANIKIRFTDKIDQGGGMFDTSNGTISIGTKGGMPSKERLREILVHEIQHGVQTAEHFNFGSNHSFVNKYNNEVTDLRDTFNFIDNMDDATYDSIYGHLKPHEAQALYQEDRLNAWNKWKGREHEVYLSSPGEIESRAVEARLNLTDLEKADTPITDSMRRARVPANVINDERFDIDRMMEEEPFMPRKAYKNQYNKGGAVEEQMELALGDKRTDPVSGNEVPPGATEKEVRDDVDVKVSEGEYIIPANVVRFLGLDKIERMVQNANNKLAEMEEAGRIGGEPVEEPVEEDDLPFSTEELMSDAPPGEGQGFAEGGDIGFSSGDYGAAPFGGAFEQKQYENSEGRRLSITFINGVPIQQIPEGFRPAGEVKKEQTQAQPEASVQRKKMEEDRNEEDWTGTIEENSKWAAPENWEPKDFEDFLAQGKFTEGLGKGVGVVAGPIGWAIQKGYDIRGNRAYEELQKRIADPELDADTKNQYQTMLDSFSEEGFTGRKSEEDMNAFERIGSQVRDWFTGSNKQEEAATTTSTPTERPTYSGTSGNDDRPSYGSTPAATPAGQPSRDPGAYTNTGTPTNVDLSDRAPTAAPDNFSLGSDAPTSLDDRTPSTNPDDYSVYKKGGLVKKRNKTKRTKAKTSLVNRR